MFISSPHSSICNRTYWASGRALPGLAVIFGVRKSLITARPRIVSHYCKQMWRNGRLCVHQAANSRNRKCIFVFCMLAAIACICCSPLGGMGEKANECTNRTWLVVTSVHHPAHTHLCILINLFLWKVISRSRSAHSPFDIRLIQLPWTRLRGGREKGNFRLRAIYTSGNLVGDGFIYTIIRNNNSDNKANACRQ